jgi:hypothetical protein
MELADTIHIISVSEKNREYFPTKEKAPEMGLIISFAVSFQEAFVFAMDGIDFYVSACPCSISKDNSL